MPYSAPLYKLQRCADHTSKTISCCDTISWDLALLPCCSFKQLKVSSQARPCTGMTDSKMSRTAADQRPGTNSFLDQSSGELLPVSISNWEC